MDGRQILHTSVSQLPYLSVRRELQLVCGEICVSIGLPKDPMCSFSSSSNPYCPTMPDSRPIYRMTFAERAHSNDKQAAKSSHLLSHAEC